MPKYRVTAPDGSEYEIDAPGGATEADAIAYVRKNMAAAPKPPARGVDGVKDSWVGGLVRGIRDPIDAGAQLVTRGLEAVAPAGSGFEAWARQQREEVEGINRTAEEDYRQNWRRGQDVGMDWGRIGGNAIATLPLTPGVGTAATMAGRALQAGRAGAIAGALEPVNDPSDATAYWGKKAAQTGLGGLAGGLVAPVAEVGIKGAVKGAEAVANAVRGRAASTSDDAVDAVIAQALGSRGLTPAEISDDVLRSLRADVRGAIRRYGGADPAAIARSADFREAGVQPLRAWVTRDPVEFTRTENLAGIAGAGEPLQYAKARLNSALIGALDGAAPAGGQFAAGKTAERAMQAANATDDEAIKTLYATFRAQAPKAQGNGVRFVDDVSRAWDDAMVAGPPAIVGRLQKIASGDFPVTFDTLEKMRKAANQQLRGAQGDQKMALGLFKDAVDREMMQMADDLGARGGLPVAYNEAFARLQGALPRTATAAEAVETITSARAKFAEVARKREAAPALQAVADGSLAPETFFRDYVQGGTVREVKALWSAVPDGEFRTALRSQMLAAAKQAAIGSADAETGTFSAAGFGKWLNQPGMKEKLAVVLGPQGLSQMQRLERLANDALRYPAGHKVNTSNTSQAVGNMAGRVLQAAEKLPYVGPGVAWFTQPARTAMAGAEAAGLAQAGPAALGRPLTLWDDPRRRAAYTLSGLLAGPAAATAITPFRD